jgi:hypothetical protein
MIFVHGESAIVAKSKIVSTFQDLLPNEDMAREYLREVSRDLRRLTDEYWDNGMSLFRRDRSAEHIYDYESIASIRETVKELEKKLPTLPVKEKQTFIGQWKEMSNPLRFVWLSAYSLIGLFIYSLFF